MESRICIKVAGINIDQFFARARRENVVLFDVRRTDYRTLFCSLGMGDYKKLKDYLNKFFVIDIISTTGLARIKTTLLKYVGVFVGIFLLSIGYIYTSTMIMKVEVYGNTVTKTSTIIDVLSTQNVKIGKVFLSDVGELQNYVLKTVDSLAEVSIEKRGTTILVNVSEKLFFAPEQYKPIVSVHAGIVKKIDLSVGTLAVRVGQFVPAGEVMVHPYIINNLGEKVSVKPLAKIEFDAHIVGISQKMINDRIMEYTGREIIKKDLYLGRLLINPDRYEKTFEFCDKIVYTKYISARNVLPLNYRISVYREIVFRDVINNFDDIKQFLIDDSIRVAREQVQGEELSLDTVISENSGRYVATTTIIVKTIIE